MGVQRSIQFRDHSLPLWSQISEQLLALGESPVLRMIDGLPAFPNEVPEESWRELRISLSGGMITIRRDKVHVICTAWGTDDPSLLDSLEKCCLAIMRAGGDGVVSANVDNCK